MTVVGGGLTGVETAAELAEQGLPVRLVCNGPLVPSFGDRGVVPPPGRSTRRGSGIENRRVAAVGPGSITVVGSGADEEWPSATTVLATGFDIPRLAADSGLTTDPDGRLVTDESHQRR